MRRAITATPSARPLLKPVPIEINAGGRSLNDLLEAGEIDCILGAALPKSLGGNPDIVRLFPDYHAVERDYFGRTGSFPIRHTVVIRDELYAANPWVAQSLCKACAAAKDPAKYTCSSPPADFEGISSNSTANPATPISKS